MGIRSVKPKVVKKIDHGDQSTSKRPMGDTIGIAPWQRLVHGRCKLCGARAGLLPATRTNRRQQGSIGRHHVRPLCRHRLTMWRLEDLHLSQEEVCSQSAATAHFSRHLHCLWSKPRQQGSIDRSINCHSRVSPCQKGHQQ